MVKRTIPALVFCLMAGAAWAQEETPAPAADTEQVLIVGQRPGPGLWKVSKGEHVMYVFGKYGPLPDKMEWRSHEVEAILAKSQEYLAPPSAGVGVGIWGGIKLLPQLIGYRNLPDGAKLQDVLTPETYARWQTVKAKYIGANDSIERERPLFVADTLYRAGLKQAGLSSRDQVQETIGKLVKKSGIKVTSSAYRAEVSDASQVLKDFKRSRMEDEACFALTLDRIEIDLGALRERANAWAVGDVGKISKLDFAERENACRDAVKNSPALKERQDVQEVEAKAHALWLRNAEKALENNASTFAVLPISAILSPSGVIASLKAKGYQVEAPE